MLELKIKVHKTKVLDRKKKILLNILKYFSNEVALSIVFAFVKCCNFFVCSYSFNVLLDFLVFAMEFFFSNITLVSCQTSVQCNFRVRVVKPILLTTWNYFMFYLFLFICQELDSDKIVMQCLFLHLFIYFFLLFVFYH